jgi:predicted phage baseplate assembly protein
MSAGDPTSCPCGCCQGTSGGAPVHLANRPGLSALTYRLGTHSRFKGAMLAGISTRPALQALTTRDDDDPAIALLDAWAVSLDVLSFYQERIANEGYLRTATERRSLLELARTIGYELRPGVAASTWLAFTLDGSPGSPRQVTIPAGTRVQSLPTRSELPQSFETGADLAARPEWNALLPQRLAEQTIAGSSLFLAGVATQLRPGDALLFVAGGDATKSDFRLLTEVAADSAAAVTRVAWQEALTVPSAPAPRVYALRQRAALFGVSAPDWRAMPDATKTAYGGTTAPGGEWPNFAIQPVPQPDGSGKYLQLDLDAAYPRIAPRSWVVLRGSGRTQALQVTASETAARAEFAVSAKVTRLTLDREILTDSFTIAGRGTFKVPLFGLRETAVYAESEELTPAQVVVGEPVQGNSIGLDGLVGGLVPGRAVVVQGQRMRARVDGDKLVLQAEDGSGSVPLLNGETLEVLARSAAGAATTWRLRDRNGFAGSVTPRLPAFRPPAFQVFLGAATARATFSTAEQASAIRARIPPVRFPGGGFELPPFQAAPSAQLTLVPAEADDPVVAEVAFLADVTATKEATTLKLTAALANLFDRTTVAVLANVAAATHGETRREVLGAGDAAKRFQRFRLRQSPLTYVPAPVAGGGESTLEVRVDGVLWHESPDLYSLRSRDREYALRRDDDGNTTVRFGDGVHGARLPSGVENVEAVYRTGIGLAGQVGENRISLLVTRPLGVKSVTNPVAATGAADPEPRDQARGNAPTTVLTLDRVVSLQDFEDFARAFSGIGKARARMLWTNGRRLVHLTVAGVNGAPVVPGAALDQNFRAALDALRDPFQALSVESYEHLLFRVALRVQVDPDYVRAAVLAGVEAALRGAFSFAARDFGQSVFLSEVMAVAQGVAGVVYVDVDRLYRDDGSPELATRLTALPARIDGTGQALRGQILTLSPLPVAPEAIP